VPKAFRALGEEDADFIDVVCPGISTVSSSAAMSRAAWRKSIRKRPQWSDRQSTCSRTWRSELRIWSADMSAHSKFPTRRPKFAAEVAGRHFSGPMACEL